MRMFFSRLLCGVLLGFGAVAPGISGTIIAMAMGVYDRLIGILANPFRGLKQNLPFLVPVGAGGAIGGVGFLLAFKVMLDSAPLHGHMLFIGMVLGSLPVVFNEMHSFSARRSLVAVLAAAAALAAALMAAKMPESAAHGLAWLALCGAVTGAMSVIPGISISMVLMMLGVYTELLDAIFALDITVICAVGACFAAGMVLFSKVIKLAFERFRELAFYVVLGVLLGSVAGVFAGLPHESERALPAVAALLAGAGVSWLSRKAGALLNRGKEE